MNPAVDHYFTEGCGRCNLAGTPQCKVHNYPQALMALRSIALSSGLTEELKWGVPCYTFNKKNIAVVSAFKDYAALSFFKGSLLQDGHKLLERPGENTQSARIVKFTDAKSIMDLAPVLKAYLHEAIEIEKAGKKVVYKKSTDLEIPEELQSQWDEFPAFEKAFKALTPGRQKGYLLHFSAPKQSKTKSARIEKCIPQILNGKGLNDR